MQLQQYSIYLIYSQLKNLGILGGQIDTTTRILALGWVAQSNWLNRLY